MKIKQKSALRSLCILLFFVGTQQSFSQQFSAGINVDNPNPNAVLELVSPNGNQGLMIPKLTTVQRTGMAGGLTATENGLMVYDNDDGSYYFWFNTGWVSINVPAAIADGIDWTELSGIPADILDGDQVGLAFVNTDGVTVIGDGDATALSINTGTGPNQIVQLNASGQLPAVDGSLVTGITATIAPNSITTTELAPDAVTTTEIANNSVLNEDISSVDISKITGAPNLDADATDDLTITDVGTGPNQIVQLNASSQLPAVDGSLLTGVTATVGANSITTTELNINSVTTNEIVDGTIADADIGDVAVGKITGAPNLDLDSTDDLTTANIGTGAGDLITLSAPGTLPLLDGSNLTGVTATIAANSITTTELDINAVTTNEILDGSIINADINDVAVSKITGAPNLDTDATDDLTTTDVGTGAGQLVALSAANTLPVLDGSNLTGVPAAVAANSITTTELNVNSVTTNEIVDGTIASADIAANAVTSAEILDGTIVDADIAGVASGKVTGLGTAATQNVGTGVGEVLQFTVAGQLPTLDGSNLTGVPAAVAANSITTTELNVNSVTTNEIVDGTIASADIAANAVTSAEILDGTIVDADIAGVASGKVTGLGTAATQNVGTGVGEVLQFTVAGTLPTLDGSNLTGVPAAVAANSITTTELNINSVTTNEIVDGTIASADIAANSVTSAEILDGTIVDADIAGVASGKVTGLGTAATQNVGTGVGEVLQFAVAGQLPILDGSNLTGVPATVGANTITTTELALNSVTTNEIVDGTIAAADLAADAVTTAEITNGTIADVDLDKASIPLSGFGAAAATVDAGNQLVSNVATPVAATDAATKGYVDAIPALPATTDAQIIVSNATTPTAVTMTGDVTIDNLGATSIAANAVTTNEIANGTIADADLNKASIPLSGFGAAAATVDAGNQLVSNVATPVAATDAATKGYVDGLPSLPATTDAQIIVSNATTPTAVTMTGDVTIDNLGATNIAAGAVTTTEIANGTIADADLDKANIPLSGFGAAAATVDAGNQLVSNVATPVAATDAATKGYVDGLPSLPATTDAQIIVSNATTPTAVTMTGDVTIDNLGATNIAAGAVTTTEIANGTIADADLDKANIPLSGFGAAAATVDAGNQLVSNVATPVAATDAVTKGYVDAIPALPATTDAQIIVSNATTPTAVTMTGDVTIDNLGATNIAAGAVTTTEIANGTIADADLDKANIPLSGFGAAAATVDAGNQLVSNVATPVAATDAATKGYVDGLPSLPATTDAQIIVSNATTATAVTMAGDVTIDNLGTTTIVANAIGAAEIADGTVGNAELGADAVTTTEIANGTIADADLDKANIPLSGFGAAAATVDAGNQLVSNVATPVAATDAATKGYVDGLPSLPATTDAQIIVSNATTPTAVTMTGDVTIDNLGATNIAAGAVTTTEIANGTIADADLDKANIPLSGFGAAAATVDAGNQLVSNVATPVAATDAATKGYVDGLPSLPATTDAQIIVSSATTATAVTMAGDVTIDNLGTTTIVANAIGAAEIADGTVGNAELGADAVTTTEIANGTIADADLDKANIPLSGFGAAAATVDAGNQLVSNVATPVAATDAATKGYVDGLPSLPATTDAQIIVSNATTPTAVTMTGDVTIDNLGATNIAAGAVTTTEIANGTIADADLDKANIPLSGFGAAAATVDAGNQLVSNVATPVAATDAATKGYVDGLPSLPATTDAQIIVSSATTATAVTMAGDVTIDNLGTTTIVANAIGAAEIADGTVGNAELGADAVTTTEIANGTIADADLDKANIPLSGFGAAAATVDAGNQLVSNVATPVAATDAVTKGYVDAIPALPATTDAQIIVSNATTPTAVTMTGDVTIDNLGATNIAAGAVTTTEIANGTIADADLDKANIPLSGFGAAAATVDAGNQLVSNVATPVAATDAATKGYVDGLPSLPATTDAQIIVSNATTATAVTMAGDVTIDNLGTTTIVANAIGAAEIADGTVGNAELGADAVTTTEIANGTIADADLDKANIPLSGFGAAAATVDAGNQLVSNVATPVAATDAATKGYVDGLPSLPATTDAQIIVSNATTPTAVTMTGDVTIDNLGATNIAAGAVTTTELANGTIADADLDKANIPLSGFGAAAAAVDAGNQLVSNVATPVAATDAATKGYVDGLPSLPATTDAQIIVSNATTATAVTMAGDVTIDNLGTTTIVANAIGAAEIADGTVGNAELGADAVTTTEIANGTIADADLDKANIPLSGFGAATAAVNAGTQVITNVGTPVAATDAATKGYVDAIPALPATTDAQIIVSNATTATAVTMSGDVTIDNLGATTIAANAIGAAEITDGTVGTAELAADAVTTAEIAANTIVDADISGTAAIAATKLDATVMVAGENVSLLVNDAGYLTGEADPVWTGDKATIGSAAGTINTGTNLLDWTQLKSVPPGIADGVDDVGGDMFTATYDPGAIAGDAFNMSNHTTTTVATNGDILTYNGATWDAQAPTVTGDMFAATYDPGTIAGDAFNMSNHTTTTVASNGDILTFNGTNWDAQAPTVTGDMFAATYDPGTIAGDAFNMSNHTTTTVATNGDILTYNGATWDAQAPTVTGDMFAATYDPGTIAGDAFNMSNHTTTTVATNGDILTFNGTTWDAAAPTTLTSGNGVTVNAGNIDLGGTLTGVSTITTGSTGEDLFIAGLGQFTSDAATTNINSDNINLGNAAGDVITINGGILFEEGVNDLLLDVPAQTNTGATLRIPDLPTNDETIALLSDITGGPVTEPNPSSLVGGSNAATGITGASNTIYGVDAAQNLVAGLENTVVGRRASLLNTAGNRNTVLGFESGLNLNGNDNTMLGTGAGFNVAGGQRNVFIGAATDSSTPAVQDAVAVGFGASANADLAIAIGSGAQADVDDAIAIGAGTVATDAGTIILGDGITSGYAVGINTQTPTSFFQVGESFGFSPFDNTNDIPGPPVTANVITTGLGVDYTNPVDNQLVRLTNDSASFIFMNRGEMKFLSVVNGIAGNNVNLGTEVKSLLELNIDGNARLEGGLQLGDVDGGEEQDGMIRWNGSNLQGYQTGSWQNLIGGGFNLPFSANQSETATLFDITQQDAGNSAARFGINNGTSSVPAVVIESNGAVGSRSLDVRNFGAADAAEFSIINAGSGATAVQANTNGVGSAASFQTTNATSGATSVNIGNDGNGTGLFVNLTNGVNASPAIDVNNAGSGPSIRLGGASPIQIPSGATDGFVLTSDASGYGSWQPAPTAAFGSDTYELTNETVSFGSFDPPANTFGAGNFQLGSVASNGKAFVSASSYNNNASELRLSSSRGTQGAGGELPSQLNNVLGEVVFTGNTATAAPGFEIGAIIQARATENFNNAPLRYGTALTFNTVNTGTSIMNEVMTIRDQHVGINRTNPGSALDVNGEIRGTNMGLAAGSFIVGNSGQTSISTGVPGNSLSISHNAATGGGIFIDMTNTSATPGLTITNTAGAVSIEVDKDIIASGKLTGGQLEVDTDTRLNGRFTTIPDPAVKQGAITITHRITRVDNDVTNIDAGLEGQETILVATSPLTVSHGGIVLLNGGVPFNMTVNSTLHLVYVNGAWLEVGRSLQP